jgi:hypothetical protein
MTVPSNAIYFTAYESLKNNFQNNFGMNIFVAPIIAGFGARVVSSIATSPLEYLKTNLQATTPTEGNKMKFVAKQRKRNFPTIHTNCQQRRCHVTLVRATSHFTARCSLFCDLLEFLRNNKKKNASKF